MGGDLVLVLLPLGVVIGLIGAIVAMRSNHSHVTWQRVLFASAWFIAGLFAPIILFVISDPGKDQ